MENNTENIYSVYMHRNRLNGKVYIGITGKDPEDRWGKGGRLYHRNPYFFHAINKYGWDNFDHIILYSDLTKSDAEELEIDLIARYDSTNHDCGYNIQHGGSSTGCMNDETKQKISIANKGRPNKYKGVPLPEETKLKIGIANSGNRPVIQYDRQTGKFLNRFENLHDASNILGIDRGEICAICNYRAKSIFGFIFRYEDENFIPYKDLPASEVEKCKNSHLRPVKQYDMRGNFIKEYPSIKDAELAFGKEQGTTLIWHCVNHKKPSALGFLWSYSDEEVLIPTPRNTRKVSQYDLDKNFIQTFPSVKDAALSVNGNSSALIKCLKGASNNRYKGYIWEYA